MFGSSNLDSFRGVCQVVVQLLFLLEAGVASRTSSIQLATLLCNCCQAFSPCI